MPNFVAGMYFNQPHEKAPDFVLGSISIRPIDFIAWLSLQKQNEKGYIKISIKKSKAGKIYSELDEYEPTNK